MSAQPASAKRVGVVGAEAVAGVAAGDARDDAAADVARGTT